MINTYSDPLIALEVTKKIDRGATVCEIVAETTDQQTPSELTITFFGKNAEEALEGIVKGSRFTYRGIVSFEDRKPKLIGLTFAQID